MKRIFLVLLALVFSRSASAGDASNFKSLGFSQDGTYYAFVQSGVQDGSGFAYAKAAVVEVSRNQVVAEKSVLLEDDTALEEQAVAEATKQLNLASYGINGQNSGRELLRRLPSDYSQYLNAIFTLGTSPEGGASVTNPKYAVVIEQRDAPRDPKKDWCYEELPNTMITLSVEGKEGTQGEKFVLQSDKTQPEWRYCSSQYKVAGVYSNAQSKGLVIVINYQVPGFEGPNYRYMVTAGTPNLKVHF